MPKTFQIACCTAEQRADTLRLLHAGLPEDMQTALLHTLDTIRGQDESVFAGLLVAHENSELLSAVWIQLTPGRTAVLWPPAAGNATSSTLMRSAAAFLDKNQIALAQFLGNPNTLPDPTMLAAGDFHQIASLTYLILEASHFPPAKPEGGLQFEPQAGTQPERLGKLLLETYEGTLDCPALNGVRQPTDIVEGYSAQGSPAQDPWFFVQHDGQDVGALLLTSHAEGEHWELVYMGVVPSARGKGLGWQILQYALWQAQQSEAKRMVLAVDEKNEHALRAYRQAGFVAWDRKTVYARLRS